MNYAVYSVTAAAPSLSWGLYKIAHTPTARLRVAYHLTPRNECRTDTCHLSACDPSYTQVKPRFEIRGIRPLGNAMYLDRLLAGGIVGEDLPLANLRICLDRENLLGTQVDVVA
ncbi:MAG: hypothetical protein K8U03_09940 [Planctomycetia bacterium]|nr:hypothetical protein [Planctomycetia bacterium]